MQVGDAGGGTITPRKQSGATMIHYIADFFAGLFLCNSIPHLVSALQGQPFPTPFATPSGVGESSPLVNFLWGFANFLIALVLFWSAPLALGPNPDLLLALAGAALMGIFSSLHFGRVQRERRR